MEYRKLTINDLDIVVNMEKDFRSGFICKENAKVFLANTRNWIFAAVEKSQIIGFAYGYELSRLNDIGNMLYIHEVGVLNEYQNQGIGTNLMLKLEKLCQEMKICRIFLFTESTNLKANGLYQKVGMKKVSPDTEYVINFKK